MPHRLLPVLAVATPILAGPAATTGADPLILRVAISDEQGSLEYLQTFHRTRG